MLRIWIRDPVPFEPLDPGSGMGYKSVFRSETLDTIFWVKILKFFDTDLGWKTLLPAEGAMSMCAYLSGLSELS